MILLIDNHDSFVHNLARYVAELGEDSLVRRADAITLDEIAALRPSHVVVSPGPGSPREATLSVALIRRFGATTPILGVCLGHQCVGAAYGAEIVRARAPRHGKASAIWHDGSGLFTSVPSPFPAARYHSLAIADRGLPPVLRVTARADDGEIMAVAHVAEPVVGLQFHPESVLTSYGYHLLDRFLHGAPGRRAGLAVGPDGAPPHPDASPAQSATRPTRGRGGDPCGAAPDRATI